MNTLRRAIHFIHRASYERPWFLAAYVIGGIGITVPIVMYPFQKDRDKLFYQPLPKLALEDIYRASVPPGHYPKNYGRFLNPDIEDPQDWIPPMDHPQSIIHKILYKISPSKAPSVPSSTMTSSKPDYFTPIFFSYNRFVIFCFKSRSS